MAKRIISKPIGLSQEADILYEILKFISQNVGAGSSSTAVDLTAILNAIIAQTANDNTNTQLILNAISNSSEKELIIPISYFATSGSYSYFLSNTEIGITIINSVEIGDDLNTLSVISNYTITPQKDLIINSNTQLTTEIVRITGQK